MRIRRGVVELGLQRLDLRLQSSLLRLQPCNLLLQGGIAGGLGGALRARPRSFGGITQVAQPQANGGKENESQSRAGVVLEVLGQAATAIAPRDRSLHNPTGGSHTTASDLIPAGDDCGFELGPDVGSGLVQHWALISPSGEQLLQERTPRLERGAPPPPSVPIWKVGRRNKPVSP
jgi:hypothetical protein